MPLISTRGAASAQGFGEFAQSAAPVYIEDVFSTYLYTGNSSTQTINNGIDLAGEGGMIWRKSRSDISNNQIIDTNRGIASFLTTNTTDAASTGTNWIASFDSSGFTMNSNSFNGSPYTYASWTFRKQKKFFDVVTFTSNGSGGGTFNHSLGSTPGCVILKSTGVASSWIVYHRSTGVSKYLELQSTAAEQTGTNWISVDSTSVTVDSGWLGANRSIVAYLFAHDAGGFGLTGSDNVISCGSYTGTGAAGNPITLGYEPQYLLIKPSSMSGSWWVMDNMRSGALRPDSSAAESTSIGSPTLTVRPTATGFSFVGATLNDSSQTFIYIAIRRGPMKVPTSGTSVFSPNTSSGTGGTVITTGFPLDAMLEIYRSGGYGNVLLDRLRGIVTIPYGTGAVSAYLTTNTTGAEQSLNNYSAGVNNTGFQIPSTYDSLSTIYYSFRRAPGFFDVVCYTGDGTTNRAITHNLSVIPEFIINKPRSYADYWEVYHKDLGVNSYIYLNSTNANGSSTGNWSSMTASAFGAGYAYAHNRSSETYVTYLFATVAGVSKVGTYTGSGTTKQIDCGFTGGARFVLIKRTDSTGDWYVWDTARGIVAGNDPYLRLNSTVAEVTNTDYVDTYSAGFELSSTAPAALNANGGTYIFLAIA